MDSEATAQCELFLTALNRNILTYLFTYYELFDIRMSAFCQMQPHTNGEPLIFDTLFALNSPVEGGPLSISPSIVTDEQTGINWSTALFRSGSAVQIILIGLYGTRCKHDGPTFLRTADDSVTQRLNPDAALVGCPADELVHLGLSLALETYFSITA